ncbi:DUF6443 domain-containing protein [Dokdonia ponticola]|uniref:DUF6443 domain-containing protein n=1 Tax=Dokdonia ponticola TaxID=2041041 RepID=A0ABV9HVQ1_9FLAO
MKKIIIFVLLMFPVFVIGQTTTENYVKTTVYQVATQTGVVDEQQKIESITYYDGLGRAEQSVSVKAGGNKQNIVQMVTYDSLGRISKQYLPYATATEITNPLDFTNQGILKSSIETFYNTTKYENTLNPYSETLFENSPLSRPLRQGAPGNSWKIQKDTIADHTVHFVYDTNTVSTQGEEGDDVLHFEVIFNGTDVTQPSLQLIGVHSENRLSKTIIQDENFEQRMEAVGPPPGPFDPPQEYVMVESGDHAIEEFTNKKGQVVLKRTYDQEIPHDTYYIYDDFGNLTFVLSPEASNQIIDSNNLLVSNYQEILDKLGYQYKYDYRNRLIEKKVPAKGWEYIFYDVLDRPVLTQDARLRENNQYLFTKYDALNRVVYTGMYQATGGGSSTSIQTTINNQSSFNETRTAATSIGNDTIYYSNGVFPTSTITVHTVNYYDSYADHTGITLPTIVFGKSLTSNTKGLPTVAKVRVLGTDDWITTVTGYDEKARPIYGVSVNTYLDTEDTSESRLDFTGKVVESKTTHQKTGHQTMVTKDYYTYDHQDRLLTQAQQINTEPLQLIASNTYDELGQLESKRVGGKLFDNAYKDIVDVSVSNDGTLITKISPKDLYNAGLSTTKKIDGDGILSFTNVVANKRYMVGFNDSSNSASSDEIDYGFLFAWNNPGRYRVRIREGGVTTYITGYINFGAEDHFAIQRQGNVLSFIQNGTVVATHTMTQSFPSLVGDISMRDQGATIRNFGVYAPTAATSLQKVDYAYNVRGWLTDINPVGFGGSVDLFTFKLYYDTTEGFDTTQGMTPTPLYNGNIAQTVWSTANTDSQERSYAYTYDALNRITMASSGKGIDFNTKDAFSLYGVSYDQNGNIMTLKRDHQAGATTISLMDDLTYTYVGNQLQNVDDLSSNPQGFKEGVGFGDDYTYDVNGNLTADQNKKITSIVYNHLNLPTTIIINEVGGQNGTITYIYDATGIKLAKVLVDNSQGITKTTSYAGGYIYEDNGTVESLQLFSHPEGYVEPSTTLGGAAFQYAFNYTDHLGNVRLTYADSNDDGTIQPSSEIISEKHYYPFGLEHSGYNDVVTSNKNDVAERFMFGGKEYGQELGLDWYDISARNYDPALGRWMNIDPLAEAMRRHSPYNYAFDNPIYFTDPDGMSPQGCCEGLVQWFKDAAAGLSRVLNGGVSPDVPVGSPRDYSSRTSSRPTKNITGNYFGDMVVNLMGYQDFKQARNGDPTAQFRVITSVMLAALPESRAGTKSSSSSLKLFRSGTKSGNLLNYTVKGGSKDITTGSAVLSEKGILQLDFNVPSNLKRQGIGTEMFDDAIKTFGDDITGVEGLWTYDSNGNMSDNLKSFIDNVDWMGGSMTPEQAAFNTITGKWAKENGFTNVNILSNEIDEVNVIFTKPNE